MKFATFDPLITNQANITGFFCSDIHGNFISDGGAVPDSAVPISTPDWQASVNQQHDYWIDPQTGEFGPAPARPDTDQLASAVTTKLVVLKSACSAAINAGFVSPALGSEHRYDTDQPTDQVNLIAAGLGGVDLPYTCTDLATETKQQRPHTAEQLAQVYAEASAEKVRLLGVLDAARATLNAVVISSTLTAALVEVDAVTADFS